jgi:hypothetical protein
LPRLLCRLPSCHPVALPALAPAPDEPLGGRGAVSRWWFKWEAPRSQALDGSGRRLSVARTPVQIGPITLKHRVVMPPMSRLRAQWPSGIPSDLQLEYYCQRASDGGLILTEVPTRITAASELLNTSPAGFESTEWAENVRFTHCARNSAVRSATGTASTPRHGHFGQRRGYNHPALLG